MDNISAGLNRRLWQLGTRAGAMIGAAVVATLSVKQLLGQFSNPVQAHAPSSPTTATGPQHVNTSTPVISK